VVLFVMLRLLPGDAALMQAAGSDPALLDPNAAQAIRAQLGLDRPLPVQYVEWLGGILRGDLGRSYWTKQLATQELIARLPVTLELAAGSILVSVALGVLLGTYSALHQNGPFDYFGRIFGIFGLSVPNFWLGTLLIVLPGIWWGYVPPLGYVSPLQDWWANLRQFAAPCVALGWALSASVMRMTRSQMLEVLRQEYVQVARAKGLGERPVLYRHALKNALIPVITIAGLQIGFLLGGTVVVESVFGLPGIGSLTVQAISQRDYPLIQASVLLIACLFIAINLVVDLAYGWLDPRVKHA
jgi:peptide/nickel transport system permease protein